jgi:hypothetical protein
MRTAIRRRHSPLALAAILAAACAAGCARGPEAGAPLERSAFVLAPVAPGDAAPVGTHRRGAGVTASAAPAGAD